VTCYVVDISGWQGDVDMSPWLGAGIEGCIAKALEGMTGVDKKWSANKAKMLKWGGVPGAYHYMNNIHPGGDQCNAFLDLVPANFIHALDAEAPGPLDVDGWFKAYRRRYPNKVVWLYTNYGMWRQRSKIPDMDVPAKYGPVVMWVAGVKPGTYQSGTDDFRKIWSRVPAGSDGGLPFLGFDTYAAMQFSGSASVPGVSGPCDMSIFGGSPAELRAYANTTGDDSMSAAEVQELKDWIASQRDDFAKSFWAWKLTSGWNGQPESAAAMLARAEEFAIEAGYPYARPKGNDHADTPTHAMLLQGKLDRAVGQTDTLEASEAAQSAALAGLDADALATAVATKVLAGSGTLDAAMVKQAFLDALGEQLPNVHLAVDKPA
jgi:hypothetical protein